MEEKFKLIKRPPTEEILTEEKLKELLKEKRKLKHYIGFEVSGFVHLGTGLVCMTKVADFQKAGVDTTIFLADLHAWANKKLGGDLETIREVAGKYFEKALKLSLKCVGGDPEKSKFVLGSKLYEKLGLEYLEDVIKVSIKITLSRIRRSLTILGRKMGEVISFSQLLYVPMQVADLFALKVDIAHGGMDQRKAHVIALEVEKEFNHKVVAVHHRLLLGLHIREEQWRTVLEAKKTGDRERFENLILDVKMSKSKPESCIFVHEGEEDIRRKIMKAFCPISTELNPVWDIFEVIVAPWMERKGIQEFEIKNKKTGGRMKFESVEQIKEAFLKGKLHPFDLKNFVAEKLIEILRPAREYFENEGTKVLEEMKEIKVTR